MLSAATHAALSSLFYQYHTAQNLTCNRPGAARLHTLHHRQHAEGEMEHCVISGDYTMHPIFRKRESPYHGRYSRL